MFHLYTVYRIYIGDFGKACMTSLPRLRAFLGRHPGHGWGAGWVGGAPGGLQDAGDQDHGAREEVFAARGAVERGWTINRRGKRGVGTSRNLWKTDGKRCGKQRPGTSSRVGRWPQFGALERGWGRRPEVIAAGLLASPRSSLGTSEMA